MTKHVTEHALKQLMLLSLDGDEAAYRSLLFILRDLLLVYYRKRLRSGDGSDADDLAQDVLLAVHQRRITYDRRRPFTAWFFQIAKYKLIDHIRMTRRKRNDIGLDDELAAEFKEEAMYAHLDIDRLLNRLPENQRELIREVKLLGTTTAEASAATGQSEAMVRVSVHRGIREITRQLGFFNDQK